MAIDLRYLTKLEANHRRVAYTTRELGVIPGLDHDSTDSLQAAMDWCAGKQVRLHLSSGMYKITAPLIPERNLWMEGDMYGQQSVIYPYDCAAFRCDGDLITGGFLFNTVLRNFMINASNITTPEEYIILLNNAYRCVLEQLRIVQVNNSSLVKSGIKTTGIHNVNILRRNFLIGNGDPTPTGVAYLYQHRAESVVFSEYNDEAEWQIGHNIDGCGVDLSGQYTERTGNGIRITASTEELEYIPQINISGGIHNMASASAVGILLVGEFFNNEVIKIDGVRFSSNNHATKTRGIRLDPSFEWLNDNKISLENIDWSFIDIDPLLAEIAAFWPTNPLSTEVGNPVTKNTFKKLDVPEGTTEIFRLSEFGALRPHNPVWIEVVASAQRQGYSLAREISRFDMVDRADTAVNIAPKEVVSAPAFHQAGSTRYEFTSFEVTAAADGDEVVFSLTTAFDTYVLSLLDEVYFEVTVHGNCKLTKS